MYALISDCDGEFLRSSLSDIADFQDAFFFFFKKGKKALFVIVSRFLFIKIFGSEMEAP